MNAQIIIEQDEGGHAELAAAADFLYRMRRIRDRVFQDDSRLFSDPAWDLLLDLYVARARKQLISISSACYASAAPATTALRYIDLLEKKGMVRREAHPEDRRSEHLFLTKSARKLLERSLTPVADRLAAHWREINIAFTSD